MRCAWLVCLAACNQLFDIRGTTLVIPDAPQLLDPGKPMPCDGVVPDFASWTYARRSFPDYPYAASNSVQFGHFYGDGQAIVGDGQHVFDLTSDGKLVEIVELAPTDGTTIITLAVSPNGKVVWFTRGGVLVNSNRFFSAAYYALRGEPWTVREADLGLPGSPNIAWPTSVAYYGGSVRMTLTMEDTFGGPFRMTELTSDDGFHWTGLTTLDGIAGSGPSLSPDGCLLMYTNDDPGTTNPKLYLAARDDKTGGFGSPMKIGGAEDQPLWSQAPAVDAARQRLWYYHMFTQSPCCDGSLMEGTP